MQCNAVSVEACLQSSLKLYFLEHHSLSELFVSLTNLPRRKLLLRDSSTSPYPDDREHLKRAREAAEALFRPKGSPASPSAGSSAPNASPSAEHEPVRKPRVFAMPQAKPLVDNAPLPSTPKRARASTKARSKR